MQHRRLLRGEQPCIGHDVGCEGAILDACDGHGCGGCVIPGSAAIIIASGVAMVAPKVEMTRGLMAIRDCLFPQ